MVLTYIVAIAALAAPDESDVLSRINWKAVYTLTGQCGLLLTPGTDYTSSCSGTLFQMEYRDGRQSWAFGAKGKALISFSGMEDEGTPAISVFKIDHVTVTSGPNATARAETATGSCVLTIPGRERFQVKCNAHTSSGDFDASFTSDGKAPEVINF